MDDIKFDKILNGREMKSLCVAENFLKETFEDGGLSTLTSNQQIIVTNRMIDSMKDAIEILKNETGKVNQKC